MTNKEEKSVPNKDELSAVPSPQCTGTTDERVNTDVSQILKLREHYRSGRKHPQEHLSLARGALMTLGTLNEEVAGWAFNILIEEVAKKHGFALPDGDDRWKTDSWPPDMMRDILADLAMTMRFGLPRVLAYSIGSDLWLANRGIKPEWFLVGNEKLGDTAKGRAAREQIGKRRKREKRKECQLWFVSWVYFHGFRGEEQSTYDAEWHELASRLGEPVTTIEKWKYSSQSLSLDKHFGEGATCASIEFAKEFKQAHLDDPEGIWGGFFDDEIFETYRTAYLFLKAT